MNKTKTDRKMRQLKKYLIITIIQVVFGLIAIGLSHLLPSWDIYFYWGLGFIAGVVVTMTLYFMGYD